MMLSWNLAIDETKPAQGTPSRERRSSTVFNGHFLFISFSRESFSIIVCRDNSITFRAPMQNPHALVQVTVAIYAANARGIKKQTSYNFSYLTSFPTYDPWCFKTAEFHNRKRYKDHFFCSLSFVYIIYIKRSDHTIKAFKTSNKNKRVQEG